MELVLCQQSSCHPISHKKGPYDMRSTYKIIATYGYSCNTVITCRNVLALQPPAILLSVRARSRGSELTLEVPYSWSRSLNSTRLRGEQNIMVTWDLTISYNPQGI